MNATGPIRDAPTPKKQASAEPSSPPREAVESFDRLMDGRKNGDGDGQASNDPQKGKEPGGLSDLFGQASRALADPVGVPVGLSSVPLAATGVGGSAVQATSALTQAQCGELVERILVSQPTADGAQEIRLRLDRQWLPDTEVRLVRAESGLSVEFVSDDVGAQRFLLPNLSALRERLAERLDGAVTVRMSENAAADGDADTGDGRSRNRRNLFEEMAENRSGIVTE